jgi:hypothetical protein
MLSGNLQGGTNEKANSALHCANSFHVLRGAGLVALAAGTSLTVAVDTADARLGRPLTPMSVAGVNRRMHRRAYRSYHYGNSYAY